MKQFITGNAAVTYHPGQIRTIKLESPTLESGSLKKDIFLYADLFYKLNKEDEFDKTLYWEEDEDNEAEDEFNNEEENTRNNYEEDYEFDSLRHK